MRRRRLFLLFSLSLLFLVPGGLAQENQTEEEARTVLVELDKATWISGIDWNPENRSQVKVTVQSKIPKPIAIQEIPDYSGRSGSFSPFKRRTLSTGENILYVPVNGRGTLGIALTDQNDGAYYKKRSQSIPDPKPIDSIFIAIYGASMTALTFYGKRFFSKFKLKRGYIRE